MNPEFNLYFKTDDLYNFIIPKLYQIPDFFVFKTVKIGIPALQYFDQTNPVINGFPFPVNKGDVYIFDDEIPATAVGLGSYLRASIRVRPEDSIDVVIARIWHELLHAVGQPADDMAMLLKDWASPLEQILWVLWDVFNLPHDVPFWQNRFYKWLTQRAEETWA